MPRPLHIVVVGRYGAALAEFSPRLASLNKCRMTAVDKDGRDIWFVSVVNPDRLVGVRAETWQFSACALVFGSARARGRVERIMAANGSAYEAK